MKIEKTIKMHLETERLVINAFSPSDKEVWRTIEASAEVRKYIDGQPLNPKDADAYIDEIIESYRTNGFGRYAVRHRESSLLMGMCGFRATSYGLDFGYRYAPEYWGQGYGFEAAKAVLDYGLNMLKLDCIVALAFKANSASIRIIENLNFEPLGPVVIEGETVEKYEMTQSIWQNS